MLKIVKGDLLKQDVEAIVNAWNRNFIPYQSGKKGSSSFVKPPVAFFPQRMKKSV